LTKEEKGTRDEFVNEYILDFNASNAVSRMGYNKESLQMMSNAMMRDAYVIRQIEIAKKDVNKQRERRKEWCGKELMEIVKDKQNNANSRVAAIKSFSELHGLTAVVDESTIDDVIKITRLIINENNASRNTHT